jgi:hypothetical protein
MKLTKKAQARLRQITADLQRVQNFILKDETAVCRVSAYATTTLDFTNPHKPDRVLSEIDKEIGSLLSLLPSQIQQLSQFIEANQ